MTSAAKRRLLLLFLLLTAALALIAAGLPFLDLRPGLPPPYFDNGQIIVQDEPELPPVNYPANSFVLWAMAAFAVLGLLYLLFRAAQGKDLRELFRQTLKYGSLFVILALVLAMAVYLLPNTPPVVVKDIPIPPPPPAAFAPLGAPPASLTWLVGLALAVCAALVAVWFVRARPKPQPALVRLGQEAEKARQALLTGMSLREVILECYREMSRVLAEENGIDRHASMTTGEFERLLAAQGFPAGPVQQLTRLFDAVRYGRWQPGLDDDQKAIACLEAITRCSQQMRQEAANG